MQHLLDNPVYHALNSGDARLSNGDAHVKYFDPEVSPFVAFADGFTEGFEVLRSKFSAGRHILYATRKLITEPKGWHLAHAIEGTQFVFEGKAQKSASDISLVPLTPRYSEEMVKLAALTKPGPFAMRTIEFGHYHGVFDGDRLVAMTGQRLHPSPYTEISAVCTHPDYLGRGYAAALIQHQLQLIQQDNKIPFLHVRADNDRAIALYNRLGFRVSGPMHFYFMKRKEDQHS